MYLKKLILVNWGNIPNIEMEFGPLNLFSGGNGSGKTTAADAIQTLLTAAHENLFQFNPGQDETTQKGRGGKKVRTLASYVLGCDDGSYARLNPTDGYLVGIFHPTEKEQSTPFAAMIAVRAFIERAGQNKLAKQDQLQFYIIKNQFDDNALSLNHFIFDLGENKSVLTIENLHTSLIGQFGNPQVEKYDTKRAYLRRLYGALRGRKDAVSEQEALNAAKAFSRFMAYKPVQSIDRFVSEEILERKDLGEAVRSISSQLKTIHAMERDSAKLIQSIDVLKRSQDIANEYAASWGELKVLHYQAAALNYKERQKQYIVNKDQQKFCQQQIKQHEADIELTRERREQLHEQRVALEAQRLGVAAIREKDELTKQIKVQEKNLQQLAQQLLTEDKSVNVTKHSLSIIQESLKNTALLQSLPELVQGDLGKHQKRLREFLNNDPINIQALLSKELLNDITMLEKQLDAVRSMQQAQHQWYQAWYDKDEQQKNLFQRIADKKTRLSLDIERAAKEQEHQQKDIERLQRQEISYPDYILKAIEAIKLELPKAEPRVLCDHIEVMDSEWQAAIEGYLGGARFSIIVEPEYEADAIRLIRRLPGKISKAKVIQGEKAAQDAARLSLEKQSIVSVLSFTHATAKNYLIASYGSVLRVDDADTLRLTRRGVTKQCLASGNYSLWRCDINDSDLVFGAAAREKALVAKLSEAARLQNQWQLNHDRFIAINKLHEAIEAVAPFNMADCLSDILSCHRQLQKLENLIENLDLGDNEQLESKLKEFKVQEEQLRHQEESLIKQIGQFEEKLLSLGKTIARLADEQEATQEKLELSEHALKAVAEYWSDFDDKARLEQADAMLGQIDHKIIEQQVIAFEQQLHANERKLEELIRSHNQIALPGDGILYDAFTGDYDQKLFKSICLLIKQMDSIYNRLKNNILVEKHGQLSQLKESFNNAFVSNLCHSIHQAINDGQRQIEQLNQELQYHRFGDDRETFRFDYDWLPEYKEYAKFFAEIIRNPELGDGQTLFTMELSKSSEKVRDRLLAMLLEEDESKALRELERIADYRNYHKYEIYKEVEGKPAIALSEYGTGSGGQLETPAYIIRAAAITNAFRFSEGLSHLRLVLVDEAFSKMDETRSREVIQYLTQSLGLQLVFIMPTSKCGPYMDLITNEFVYAKVPSGIARGELNTRVLVDRKVCNQDKIQALWQNHRNTIYQQAELEFLQQLEVE